MVTSGVRGWLSAKIKEFIVEFDRSELEAAWKAHSEFLKKYPFREHPELIDSLAPEKLYKKGVDDYFFLWVEHRTRALGAIFTYGGLVYPNAVANIDRFKELLKIAVDDRRPLREKIDARWEDIKGFGGDKLIAKKIIFLYYPDEVVPIFKTEHLESILERLGVDARELEGRARRIYSKGYDGLTVGERFELLNNILLEIKSGVEEFKGWDNAYYMRFLYFLCPLSRVGRVRRQTLTPLAPKGVLFTPVDELGVVCLFFKHHEKLGFPYIVRVSDRFPDVTAIDENGEFVKIELEYRASDFIAHGHPPDDCDYVVCWENDLKEVSEEFPRIISLSDEVSKLVV